MMVKFATTCDRCTARSDEYTAWPACSDCGRDTCRDCMAMGSLVSGDGEVPDTCRCVECADPLAEQVEAARKERR